MNPQASRSNDCTSSRKKRAKLTPFTATEKQMIIYVYEYIAETWETDQLPRKQDLVTKTANILRIGEASVYRILRDFRDTGRVVSPKRTKTRPTIFEKIDNFGKSVIRKNVHSFFKNGELPTFNKVFQAVNEEESLPHFSRSGLYRMLKHLKFKYATWEKDKFLTERDEIIMWRRKYLNQIKRFREEKKLIYYVGETSVSVGHSVKINKKVKLESQASSKETTRAPAIPLSKGKHYNIVHIGNENGFVPDSEWIIESKPAANNRTLLNAENFEKWFESVLPKLGENSVVVLDNAPYLPRRQENMPDATWKKTEIQEWLKDNNIDFSDNDIKLELLHIIKAVNKNFTTYVVDDLATRYKVDVIRLPPCHCELSPIELIWVDFKNYVARNNTSLKIPAVQDICVNAVVRDAIKNISPEKWKNCVDRVKDEEKQYPALDYAIDTVMNCSTVSARDSDSDVNDDADSSSE